MKKLGQMSKRIDEIKTGKTIRCLVVEDYKTGNIKKIRDHKMFKDVIENTDEMFLTKVYQPTEQEKIELIKYIQGNAIESNGQKHFKAKDEEVYMWLLRFTDIEPSENEEENIEAINNPNELLIQVTQELSSIMMQVISQYQDVRRAYDSLPEEFVEALNEAYEQEEEKKAEEEIEMENEMKQLQERLKELESKING